MLMKRLYHNYFFVIPAQAGIQEKNIKTTGCRIKSGMTKILDSRLRGNDSIWLITTSIK
jgi:hypothetical protein